RGWRVATSRGSPTRRAGHTPRICAGRVAPGMAAANNRRMLARSRIALLAELSLVSCRDADGSQKVELRPAPVTPSANAAKPVEDLGPHPADDRGGNQPLPDDRKDSKKGDREDSEWVPQEFKAGMSRWKDAGVYVDGKP